ncbi:glycosyltransferase family protein [Brevibacterium atlanticum]|uniref:hypothetical protein n=1 Tax=Brevibacterium atlanticum TaxID=2697563 RepID=UPI00141F0E63|nr:hypothetical protein [Brevibacterium atlanticum]
MLKSRRNTIKNLSKFDLVAQQTRQQRDHLRASSLEVANTRIVPGSLLAEACTSDDARPRDEHAGIVVATLSALKRVDHSIRRIHEASQGAANVSLAVCGYDVERDNLETHVDDPAWTSARPKSTLTRLTVGRPVRSTATE